MLCISFFVGLCRSEGGTHSVRTGVLLFCSAGKHSVRLGVLLFSSAGLGNFEKHSVRVGVLLFCSAGLGIVVFFDDDVHVHICHHLAQVRHGYASGTLVNNGHLGGISVMIDEKLVGRGDTVWLMEVVMDYQWVSWSTRRMKFKRSYPSDGRRFNR